MRKWLRRRKAHSVARQLMRAFRTHGNNQATALTKAPRWYFVNDLRVSRSERLRKMARVAARYIQDATGDEYSISVEESSDNRIWVHARLVPPNASPEFTFIPQPRLS
jgi:hypothetical protein